MSFYSIDGIHRVPLTTIVPRGHVASRRGQLPILFLRETDELGVSPADDQAVAPEATGDEAKTEAQFQRTSRQICPVRLPDLEIAKSAVLNSLSCPDAERGYRHAIDEFVDWYCSEPRPSFSKTVVIRYRMHLESRQLTPGTI
jgi:hypothetical protein